MRKNLMTIALLAVAFVMVLSACGQAPTTAAPATQPPAPVPTATQAPVVPVLLPTTTPAPAPFIFGMLLVGPHNDQGWSQATYDGSMYVTNQVANTQMLYLENVFSGSPSYP